MKKPAIPLSLNFAILALFWTIFIIAMGVYDYHSTKVTTVELARIQAITGLEKDIIYRKWNALNGGVYGSISDKTVPNPYLTSKERDIATPSGGRQLTLINPAYMTRQVHELEIENNGVVGHITSLLPIRPENKADEWEAQALKKFEAGVAEVSSLEQMNGNDYLRVMKPLMVTGACLACHATQGYQVGEVRGGLSISVPMKQWYDYRQQTLRRHIFFLAGLWLVVLIGLSFGFWNLRKKILLVDLTQNDLNKLKNVLDQINDSVFLVEPRTLLFTYVNQAALHSSGYSEDELFKLTLEDIFPGRSQFLNVNYVEKLKKKPEKIFHFESAFTNKKGELSPVDVQLQYLKLEQGTELVAAVLRDISSRKDLEEKQRAMVEQLQRSQKLESVGQLAAGIAHEINTPVQYIGSNLDFLQDNFSDVRKLVEIQQSYIETDQRKGGDSYAELVDLREEMDWEYLGEEIPQAIIQSQDGVKQISSIVLAMKDFSHPGSGEKVMADVNHLIQTIVTVARNEWKGIADVRLDLTKQGSSVPCLPNEISQVFLNILVNAAHAIADCAEDGDESRLGSIDIKTHRMDQFIEVQIQDSGQGIPANIINRIFDPFFTTKEVGKGTGQGLAIAHDIITKKHNGSLEAISEEGKGTIFTIHLPLDDKEQKNLMTEE
ncbi:ATP-binding protein [Desulforhopalus sp. 52FAK]